MFGIGGGDRAVRPLIRQALPEDYADILRIGREAFPYIREPEVFFAQRMREGIIFVAETEQHVIGFVDLSPREDGMEVEGIAVDPEWRGKGVGKALLTFAVEFARKLGFSRVFLHTRDAWSAAVALYESLGFVRREKLKEDIWVWERRL